VILLINIGRPNEWSRHGPTIVSLTQQNWRAASILREPSGICFALDVTITSSPRLSTFLLTTYSGHDFFYMHRACKPFVELSVLPSVTVSEREASSRCSSNRRPQTPQNACGGFTYWVYAQHPSELGRGYDRESSSSNALVRVSSKSRKVSTMVISHARVAPLCPNRTPLNSYANVVQITIVKSAYPNPSPSSPSSSSSSSFHINACLVHPHLHLTASFRGVGG